MKVPRLRALQILILAAGFSRRLGRPKALARVRGVSLIRRLVLLTMPFSRSPVIVVVPPRAMRIRAELRGLNVLEIANARRAEGLSASVRRGLQRSRYCSAALLLPVDLVHLDARDIGRLIARWRKSSGRVAARRVGDRGAAPVILPRRFFSRAMLSHGDIGLRDFLRELTPPQLALVEMPSAGRDVDTPQDLAAARRSVTSQRPVREIPKRLERRLDGGSG